MAEYPYTQNWRRLRDFIDKIREGGIPDKVTTRYLESLGFKSKNDRPFVGILKFLGLVDSSQSPTDEWQLFRNKNRSGAVIAVALKSGYSELFRLYPDAHRKDDEAILNFFSTHSKLGKAALNQMVQTFKALADIADFDSGVVKSIHDGAKSDLNIDPPIKFKTQETPGIGGITVNINIELSIPDTSDSKTYDLFFQALKKHLITGP